MFHIYIRRRIVCYVLTNIISSNIFPVKFVLKRYFEIVRQFLADASIYVLLYQWLQRSIQVLLFCY